MSIKISEEDCKNPEQVVKKLNSTLNKIALDSMPAEKKVISNFSKKINEMLETSKSTEELLKGIFDYGNNQENNLIKTLTNSLLQESINVFRECKTHNDKNKK